MTADDFFTIFFAIIIVAVAAIIGTAALAPRSYTEEGEISRWLEETQRVDITIENGWSAGVVAKSDEPFGLDEAYEGRVIPGGIKLEGVRTEDGYYVDTDRVPSGTSLVVTEGRVFLTASAESDITLEVWMTEAGYFFTTLVLVILAIVVLIALLESM